MRGENRLDMQALQQRRDLAPGHVRVGELAERRGETALLGFGGALQVIAAPPDSMNPLGEIDDLEVRRERAHEHFRLAGRQAFDQSLEVVVRARDPRKARALDALEELVAALLAQDVTDQRAERADVVLERNILRRELGQEASAGVNSRTAPTPQAARSSDARPSLPTVMASPFCSTSVVRRASL